MDSKRGATARASSADVEVTEAMTMAEEYLNMDFDDDIPPALASRMIQAVLLQPGMVQKLPAEIVAAFRELGYVVAEGKGKKAPGTNVTRALANRKRAAESGVHRTIDDLSVDDGKATSSAADEDAAVDADAEDMHDFGLQAEIDEQLTETDADDVKKVLRLLRESRSDAPADALPRKAQGLESLRGAFEWIQTLADGSSMLDLTRKTLLQPHSTTTFAPSTRAYFEMSSLAALVDSFTPTDRAKRITAKEMAELLFTARFMGHMFASDKGMDLTWSKAFLAECVSGAVQIPPHIALLRKRLSQSFQDSEVHAVGSAASASSGFSTGRAGVKRRRIATSAHDPADVPKEKNGASAAASKSGRE